MNLKLYPFAKGLRSTRLLRSEGARIRYSTSRVKSGVACTWGNPRIPEWSGRVKWVNHPSAVRMVSDKLNWAQLCEMQGFGLRYTSSPIVAATWAGAAGSKVVCRTVLGGKGGEGIVIARNPAQVVEAPLYSAYQPKTREYRVIYSPITGVVYSASKRRRPDFAGDRDDKLVRTMDRGWVYQQEEEVPIAVLAALGPVSECLLTYGLRLLGYDVLYNGDTDTAVVVEANTAWGLSSAGSAATTYAAMQTIGESL